VKCTSFNRNKNKLPSFYQKIGQQPNQLTSSAPEDILYVWVTKSNGGKWRRCGLNDDILILFPKKVANCLKA
jgi:hypothetical protein